MRVGCFVIFGIHKYSVHFGLYIYWNHNFVIHFSSTFFARYKEYIVWCNSNSLVGLQVCYQLFLVRVLLVIFERICLGVNILRCKCSEASQSETLATSTTSVGRGANIPARERLETLATWAVSSRLTAPLLGADKNIPLLKPS